MVIAIGSSWFIYLSVTWIVQKFFYHPLSYVIITGNRQYTTNDDICNKIISLGVLENFLKQDVDVIQKQIESLPWIYQVSIRKQWPDTLKIHVVEHVPIAYWNDVQMVSAVGVIFNIPIEYQNTTINTNGSNSSISVPVLYGPDGNTEKVLIHYYMFYEILNSAKIKIQSASMDNRYTWKVLLQNNILLKLGRNNILDRLYYFVKVYPVLIQKINKKNLYIDYVDLRYTSGFAVRWVPASKNPIFFDK